MAWVLFEVLLAFGIAVFIVWWTFPKEKKRKRMNAPSDGAKVEPTAPSDRPSDS